ncbi:MAG TPA: serine/threonine-protein kinase [Kofleriaceae bacterium]
MTTYDPRSGDVPSPTSPGDDGGREPTQSLSLVPDDGQDSPAELAVGTHNRPVTRIESPAARGRTAPPGSRIAPHARRPEDPDDYLGAVLGSYRVVELLGKGGMGYVFRAEHVKLGREVALKLLRSDYASRRDAVARFFQEARTVNRVRHRNIVDVTDFVELDDGTTYIVMELLSGTSLGAWGASGVDLPRALAVLVQICDGLAAAHQVGVVHRDLKPDNVIVVPTSDGAELVKLLDFGVAKLLNRDDEDVGFQTAAGSVIGTPAYMSPEQAGGMVVDARSDIYSLGAIMYELFTGQPMFRGRSFGEYVRKHLTETPEPPRQTPGGAAIDPRLEALILRCLDKDPDQRFALISELREALLHLLGGTGSFPERLDSGLRSQIGPGVAGAPPPQPQPLGAISYPPQARPAAAPWWPWLAAGTAASAVGIAAAIWYAGGADAPAPPPRPPSRAAAAAAAPTAPAAVPAPPTTEPIATPPARPQLLEVRFDAQPGGSVFAEGRPAELCHTPCAFDIDPSDGGPADHRVFVVRRPGYVDSPITVDLTGDQREFQVVLQRSVTGKADAADRRPGKRPGKPPKKDRATRASGNAGDADLERPGKPAEAAPPAARPAPAIAPIDPADTLDPFRKK